MNSQQLAIGIIILIVLGVAFYYLTATPGVSFQEGDQTVDELPPMPVVTMAFVNLAGEIYEESV